MAVGVPSAMKTFNWLATLMGRKHTIYYCRCSSHSGFVSLFVSGGVTGMLLAQPAVDIPLHDTYFVVAHFHLIMGVAAIFGIFPRTSFWFPKMLAG